MVHLKTRPDTQRPQSHVSGQRLYLRSQQHLDSSSEAKDNKNINSRKSVRWSAVPVPCLSRLWLKLRGEQGSGPEGVDDLCFHTYGEFSPPPPPHSPSPSLWAHISAWRPISQPRGPNPSLEAQIPRDWYLGLGVRIGALRVGFGPQGWD